MNDQQHSRADALTDWTDEDSGAMLRAIDAIERIASGMTQTSADHLFAKTKPRKMTITDAKELASVHLPGLRRLFHKMEGLHVAASPVEQPEKSPAPEGGSEARGRWIQANCPTGDIIKSPSPSNNREFPTSMSESDCEHRIALAPSQPAAAPLDKPSVNDTITFSGDSLTLSGAQLLEALDFIAPDRDADQLESEVTIQYGEGHTGKGMYCWCTEYPEEGAIFIDGSTAVPAAPAPSPADERAAFEWPLLPLLPETVITTADGEAVFTAHQMQGYANAYGEMVRAHASAANETGAEGADALAHEVWSAAQRAPGEGIEDAVQRIAAILSRSPAMAAEAVDWRELSRRLYVELFHCDQQMRSTRDEDGEPHWTQSAVVRDVLADAKAALEGAPEQAAEAMAISDHDLSTSAGGRGYIAEFFAKRLRRHDFGRYIHERLAADFACALAQYLRDRDAAPQPAQADARVGLTERQRMDLLLVADDMAVSGDAKLADALRALLAIPQPGPRAEVTDEKTTHLIKTLSDIVHDQTVAMQSAIIEWKHGKGAEAGLSWIVNTLAGPGHLPDFDAPHGKHAQFWFNANQANPLPACFCGNPSSSLWMGKGFCCDKHYREARAKYDAIGP
ncbi:hypothetical protein [Burkholderia vietnamiensis]|uniref:hypothetical protein n=1 Tax=Burkholderia vietnamiensis TaxID=60552 RepID=UPI000A68E1A2|nr:hypothetical protein [Burkholderia vietnamiensis]